VQVRLVRSGVNPTDWKFRTRPMPFPEVVPGHDGAGVVSAVGGGVTSVEPGQRVWVILAQHGRPFGTAAEYTTVPADRVFPLPDASSFDVGASLGVPAITAHRALTSARSGPTRLKPGSLEGLSVLVAGGAGAVGNAAIQLACWAGATVVTTVSSTEKAALARSAGAHHVLNYRDVDVAADVGDILPEGVDLVVEVAPAVNNSIDLDVTKVHGTVAIYANEGGDRMEVPVRRTFAKNLSYEFIILYTLRPELLRAGGEDVSEALRDNAIRVGPGAGLPLHHYSLEQVSAAHDAVEAGVVGKVLLDVSTA
jgi:NADPH2:quinone reductase